MITEKNTSSNVPFNVLSVTKRENHGILVILGAGKGGGGGGDAFSLPIIALSFHVAKITGITKSKSRVLFSVSGV